MTPRISKPADVAGLLGLAGITLLLLLTTPAPPARADGPDTDVHELTWLVHEDLITGPRPLSFYAALVAQATQDATELVKGGQGPVDSPCCMAFSDLSVSTFTDSGSGFDLLEIDSGAELTALNSIGGSGARAFIVQALNFCAGPGSPIGCADTPSCGSEPATQKLIVSMEAFDLFDIFGGTLAHERGHNACLTHVTNDACELMAASSAGGCLSSSECAEFVEDAQTTSGTCDCYADASTFSADGSICSEGVPGVCSGGLCGDASGDAGVRLFAAAGTAAIVSDTPDDPLRIAAASGNWEDLGEFPSSQSIEGAAYAGERSTLYAVGPGSGGDDLLFTIDPDTGATTQVTAGAVTGLDASTDLVALAWDPGPTSDPSDDRLFALDRDGSGFNDLYAIDPDTAVATKLGPVSVGGGDGFTGLAYDPVNAKLYASAAFGSVSNPTGLFVIATTCGGLCSASEVIDAAMPGQTNKFESGLAYSATSASLYHTGYQSGPRTEYDSYDAADLATGTVTKNAGVRGIQGFTTGGLAAIPAEVIGGAVPALHLLGGLALAAGLVLAPLLTRARRR